MRAKSLRLCSTLCNPMDCIACQDPLAMGFSRQEYWNGLPCPLQGIFPNQGLNLSLLYPLHWQAGSLPLVPSGKPLTNSDSILENRDIILPTKVCIIKAMVFSVVMYGCESWTIKKPECWIIDAFELWCWKRLLRVPWTARRLNQSVLKEISPKYSLEGLMLKLKFQYFGHLMWRTN